jgi:hypothetical protein
MMKALTESLRALARVYRADEPEDFRLAEQFGIDDRPALLEPPCRPVRQREREHVEA